MNIFYWAVAFLKYEDNIVNFDEGYYDANKAAAIAFIVAYGVYAFVRFCFHKIGGLYMFKRLLIATILAAAVYDQWGYVLLMLGLEIVFTVLRFVLERPKRTSEKVFIVLEWLLFSLAYILMFFVLEVGVTAFICMGIIFIMVVLLFSDLMDVYLNAENQFAELVPKGNSSPDGQPQSDRRLME
jgi:hypothetical protein